VLYQGIAARNFERSFQPQRSHQFCLHGAAPVRAGRPSVRTASRLGTSAGLPGWSSTCLSRRSHLFGAGLEAAPYVHPKLSATAVMSSEDFGDRLERAILRSIGARRALSEPE